MSEGPQSAFRLDPELVREFVEDRLDESGRAELAEQIARLLPFHAQMPNPIGANLVRMTEVIGGHEALLDWLDGYAGRPRITARLFRVIELLDRYSAAPGVVQALAELRARDPIPHGLAGYLQPDTTSGTLGSLSQQVEALLADDRPMDAQWLALRSLRLLAELAPRAAELDPQAADLAAAVQVLDQEIGQVAER